MRTTCGMEDLPQEDPQPFVVDLRVRVVRAYQRHRVADGAHADRTDISAPRAGDETRVEDRHLRAGIGVGRDEHAEVALA